MSSSHKNLNEFSNRPIPSGNGKKVAIIVSEWNEKITGALYDACYKSLLEHGTIAENITTHFVPGSFELVAGANQLYHQSANGYDAYICLGCVIQGETRHFDFICNAVANGLVQLTINHNRPFVFGVLTPNTMQQAEDRAGGKHGNKGIEAAVTALKMM